MEKDYSEVTLEEMDGFNFLALICDGDKKKIIAEVETK